jgi:8-oxo-dGTP pyrophosphatase MutT (NUDIX family)
MLGKCIRVRVTNPIGSVDEVSGGKYALNFGAVETPQESGAQIAGAYIIGISHPVKNFDGRVVATVRRKNSNETVLVVSPKSQRFIINEIKDGIDPTEEKNGYSIECLYERSCGAIVFREIMGERRFLLIKNKRSANWGFPKGHVEKGEDDKTTARREVLEETGIHIDIIDGFRYKSEYTIQGRIEKSVTLFLATTNDVKTVIQPEEIQDYVWLGFDKAIKRLRYANDKDILYRAKRFIDERYPEEANG